MTSTQRWQGIKMAEYYFDKTTKVGKWEVQISTLDQYGFFEHDDYGEGGGLWFEGKELVDYDGVGVLPEDVIKGIYDLGFDASYAE